MYDIDIVIDGKTIKSGHGECCHIVAEHEYRHNFSLNAIPSYFDTIILPGAHSDIGGGYKDKDKIEHQYITPFITLSRILFHTRPEETALYRRLLDQKEWFESHPELKYIVSSGELYIHYWTEEDKKDNGTYYTLYGGLKIKRTIKPKLDILALHVMFIRLSVCRRNLAPIEKEIPSDLLPILRDVVHFASHKLPIEFTVQKKELSLSKYVHCSADYGEISEDDDKDRGALFAINKPRKNWIRAIHHK